MYIFNMGENIVIDKIKKGRKKYDCVKAKFPGRIECEIMNFDKMHTKTAGGGGYGFAVELENYIEIKTAEKQSISASKNINLIKHWLIVIKKAFNISENFSISIKYDDFFDSHCGLGNSASTILTICYLINYMYGNIYTENELIRLIANNYAEEYEDKLTRVPLTCVSLYSLLNGNFVFVDDNINLLYKKRVEDRFKLYLINTKLKRYKNEPALCAIIKEEKLENSLNKKEKICSKIIPSLKKDDWTELFNYNNWSQTVGSRLVFIENYKEKGRIIKEIIGFFSDEKETMVGLSSVGPLVYVITSNENIVAEYCKKNNLEYKKVPFSSGISII